MIGQDVIAHLKRRERSLGEKEGAVVPIAMRVAVRSTTALTPMQNTIMRERDIVRESTAITRAQEMVTTAGIAVRIKAGGDPIITMVTEEGGGATIQTIRIVVTIADTASLTDEGATEGGVVGTIAGTGTMMGVTDQGGVVVDQTTEIAAGQEVVEEEGVPIGSTTRTHPDITIVAGLGREMDENTMATSSTTVIVGGVTKRHHTIIGAGRSLIVTPPLPLNRGTTSTGHTSKTASTLQKCTR